MPRYCKGAHTRRGLWKVNPRVSEAARQTFVCVVNAASGFRLYSRPVTLSPLLEVFLAGKGYVMPVLSRSAGKPLLYGALMGAFLTRELPAELPAGLSAFRQTSECMGRLRHISNVCSV
jgi:hypothetical protein